MRYSQVGYSLILSIFSWQMNEELFVNAFNDSIQIRNCSDVPVPTLCKEWTQCPESEYMLKHGLIQCYQAERQHIVEGI